MTLDELAPELREALCVWQSFRKIGFCAGQIYAGVNYGRVMVQVRWRGEAFSVAVALTEITEDEWEAAWTVAAETMKASSREQLDEMYAGSEIMQNHVGLATALVTSGMYWPGHPEHGDLAS